MRLIYNLAIWCYRLAVMIAGCFNTKARKLSHGERNALALLQANLVAGGGYVWIHAASLGEFEQGRPLIEVLRRQHPERRILLTFFSPSGYEVRKDYKEVDYVSYLPIDLPWNVRNFLDIVRPSEAIFIKYEFWNNYLQELHKRNIPTYIISSIFREKQVFFKPYGSFFRNMLRYFTHLYVQDTHSRELLSRIGIECVTVAGDTRFDRVVKISREARELPLIEQFTHGRHTLVAGSSWPGDEALFIKYFNEHPTLHLIIAPHEIDESHLTEIEERLTRPHIRLSQANIDNIKHTHCIIIDSFGLLSSIYRYGQVAYIGGGFGVGIHNIIEAAVYGMPIIFGTNYEKFREAHDMIAAQCAFSISNYEQLSNIMDKLLSDTHYLDHVSSVAQKYVSDNTGAIDIIYNNIFNASHNQ